MKYKISLEEIKEISEKYGYYLIDYQENIGLISFGIKDVRINIYLTKMTVSTCINHPKKGKTQLFRKNVTKDLLEELFAKPRKHTGKGYYTKN
ncbi:MAG TPA: hypothetical protein VF677_05820 [Flavobacterium sp.]|jgi:hypothetical protein